MLAAQSHRRNINSTFFRRLDRNLVPHIRVAHGAGALISCQYALQAFGGGVRTIGDDDHSGVERIADADADADAVMKRDPSRPGAVLSNALRIGQSAMASDPSFIASVSRFGDATETASR